MDSSRVKLEVKGLYLDIMALAILRGVNINVFEKEILSIIGPNGAGKTSLLNCISGFYQPNKGDIFFDGQNITRKPSRERACLGIGRTFQGFVSLFPL